MVTADVKTLAIRLYAICMVLIYSPDGTKVVYDLRVGEFEEIGSV